MLRFGLRALATSVLPGLAMLALACGTDAVGVDACRQVETARCQQAPNCPDQISLAQPLHPGGSASDVDSCIRYYNDACLHGLANPTDPGQPAVTACVKAINSGVCDYVVHPEDSPACAWLIPPAPPPPDAASDAPEGGDAVADSTSD